MLFNTKSLIAMKYMILVSLLLTCLIAANSGLQCYECEYPDLNAMPSEVCRSLKNKNCNQEQSKKYCGTFAFTDEQGGSYFVKRCLIADWDLKCEKHRSLSNGIDPKGRKITLECCEGSFCNNSVGICNRKKMFYVVFLFSVFSLINILFI